MAMERIAALFGLKWRTASGEGPPHAARAAALADGGAAVSADEVNALAPAERRAFLDAELARLAAAHPVVAPVHSELRGVFQPDDGPVAVVSPAPEYIGALMHGGVVRRLRVADFRPDTSPVFEGSGELMAAMSERDAMAFVMWKDVPVRYHNQMRIVRMWDLFPPMAKYEVFRNAMRQVA